MSIFHALRPAGDRIRFGNVGVPESAFPEGSKVTYFDSGTSALAAAVRRAVESHASGSPEILMPAYACPDLVSATAYAGARARLVELAENRPWMDMAALEKSLGPNSAGVIAVNFLGISERLEEIRPLLRERGIPLIYDCAQSFEDACTAAAETTILSFGRGKPVSLLGGGAVLDQGGVGAIGEWTKAGEAGARGPGIRFHVKARLYNMLARPRWYWLVERLPMLGLGSTVYKPLAAVRPAPPAVRACLAANVSAHARRSLSVQQQVAAMIRDLDQSSFQDLAAICGIDPAARLLRFPILCLTRRVREDAVTALGEAGLGASRLYGETLPYVEGVPEHALVGERAFPRAESFASRLLTLPTHEDVTPRDVARMEAVLREVAGRR